MVVGVWTLIIGLVLGLNGCTFELFEEGSDMPNPKPMFDQRLLDPSEPAQLGKVFQINALPASNNNGIVLSVAPVSAGEVASGLKRIQRTLKGYQINAVNQHAPTIITLAVEATVTRVSTSNSSATVLQGVLQFGTGSGQNGVGPTGALPFGDIELDSRIIFDIASGTMLSFPASYFKLDFLYTSVSHAGFVAGEDLGPNYNVTFSLGYEQKAHATQVTHTQLLGGHLSAPPAPDTFGRFARPKYATDFYLQWSEWNIATASPMGIAFFNGNNTVIGNVIYTNTSNPPNVIPWPADCIAITVDNQSADTMDEVRCISILDF